MRLAEWHERVVSSPSPGWGLGLARAGLWLASGPYGLAVQFRNALYDRGVKTIHRAAVPVVSVGNLSLGGTGKTPCVEAIARFYRSLGVRVVILSRGYGSRSGPNDEALVLEENLPDVPHLQAPDRVALAHIAFEELEAELLLLDDGFQHRRLHRDLDVVLIDATRPATRDWLLPRGRLREPVASLKRAGIILLTRCDQATGVDDLQRQLASRFPHATVLTSQHRPIALLGADGQEIDPRTLTGQRVGAFCGLGHPEAFWRTLETLGAKILQRRTFPDHHPYSAKDVAELNDWAKALPKDAILLTTQKDMVKLRVAELGNKPCLALRVGLVFGEGEDAFHTRLRNVLPLERLAESGEDRREEPSILTAGCQSVSARSEASPVSGDFS